MKTIEDIARTAANDLASIFFASFGPAMRDAMGAISQVAKGGSSSPEASSKRAATKAPKATKERKERSSPSVLKAVIEAVEGSLAAWGSDHLAVGDIAKLADTDKALTSKALKKLFNEGKIVREGKAKFTKYCLPGNETKAEAAE